MTSKNGQNDQSKCQYELFEKIINKDNLNEAYKRVKKNKESYGIDKMGVDELLTYLKENGDQIKQSLQEGSYKPSAVRYNKDHYRRSTQRGKPVTITQ